MSSTVLPFVCPKCGKPAIGAINLLADAASGAPSSFVPVCSEHMPTWGGKSADAERDKLREENARLLAAVQAAYWHLDKYGYPNHPDADLMKSQQNVFDLARPFCPPTPGRL